MRLLSRHVTRKLLAAILATALLALTALPAVGGSDVIVEAEDFKGYGFNDLGGQPIGTEFCTGASGFYAASGIDVPGEWIRLKVTFTAEACYESRIYYQSSYGDTVKLQIRMVDAPTPGMEILRDYWLTEGYGFG